MYSFLGDTTNSAGDCVRDQRIRTHNTRRQRGEKKTLPQLECRGFYRARFGLGSRQIAFNLNNRQRVCYIITLCSYCAYNINIVTHCCSAYTEIRRCGVFKRRIEQSPNECRTRYSFQRAQRIINTYLAHIEHAERNVYPFYYL